jgi:hypothetical protein
MTIPREEMLIERAPVSGNIEIRWRADDGTLYKRIYIGYSEREAVLDFRLEVEAEMCGK